jgi:hypothetical protein
VDTQDPGTLTSYVAAELRSLKSKRRPSPTFDDLELATDIPKDSLKRYFNGHRSIPMDVLDAVAEAFGTRTWQVIFDAERERSAANGRGSNVTPLHKSVPTEAQARELGAVADEDVTEVNEFDTGDDQQ